MTSSPTARNRILKQGTGDNTNTWGDQQSSADFDMLDAALDGVTQLTVTGSLVLTTSNYVADQARSRALKILAASTVSATITIPAVEKWYLVWNASACDQIIASSGGGASATVYAGEMAAVVCDAVNVQRLTLLYAQTPTSPNQPANKSYVDSAVTSAVYTQTAFGVAIAPGNSGALLSNDGTNPLWLTAAQFRVAAKQNIRNVFTQQGRLV